MRHYGLEQQWYAFRDKGYARVARRWCEDNDVEYYQKGSGVPLEELLDDIAEDEDEPVNIVKIDTKALSTPSVLNSLLVDSGVEIKTEDINVVDDDEEETYSLTPAQAIKYHDIYKQISTLQGEIEALANEVGDPVDKALNAALSNIRNALARLDTNVKVEIVVDGKAADGIDALTNLLKKLEEDKE